MATRKGEEIEVKVAISDRRAITRRLKEARFHLETPRTFESNILYDFPDLSLRKHGDLLRVRCYGKVWKLTFKGIGKGKSGRHKRREEIETKLEDGNALKQTFLRLGMAQSFAYEKYRTEWADGQGHVVVDETPIGDYVELEGPPRWIDATARRLGLGIAEYITASYGELFYAWKRQTGSSATEMTFAEVKLTRRR